MSSFSIFDRQLEGSDFLSPGNNSTQNGGSSSSGGDEDRDAYQFVAFLMWYIFLVLCCVIPTCCAYRRRRIIEARIAQQQAGLARLQPSNIFFLSTIHSRRDGEEAQAERSQLLEEKLKATTMTVKQSDLEKPTEEHAAEWTRGRVVAMHEQITEDDNKEPTVEDSGNQGVLDYEVDKEEYAAVLRLSPDVPNGDRLIPAVCAVCLCEYEPDEEIAWSPETVCQHAFHKDCIIPWLSKKNQSKCPVCRQDFCHLPALPEDTTTVEPLPFTFSQSFAQALSMSRLEPNNSGTVRNDRDASPIDEENGLQDVALDENAATASGDPDARVSSSSSERQSLEVQQGTNGDDRVQ